MERKIKDVCQRGIKVCPFRKKCVQRFKCVMTYIDMQTERGISLGLTT